MQVVGLDGWELGGHAVDCVLPKPAGVNQNIVLVNQSDLLAVAVAGKFEGIAHQALNTESGVHRNLVGNLLRGTDANRAAVANVWAFGAFAHNDKVNVARVGKWRNNARVKLGRAQVHIVVKAEAQF